MARRRRIRYQAQASQPQASRDTVQGIKLTLDTIPEVRAAHPTSKLDHFTLQTMSEFASVCRDAETQNAYRMPNPWSGGISHTEACRMIEAGDLAAVAASDALLTTMEEKLSIPTARKRWQDCVAGAYPNVPAYIAGQPLSMRRRARDDSAYAPLAIIVDLTSSASIHVSDLRKRGAAILALVRALAARRPIELWAGCSIDADNLRNAFHWYVRIETAPLDLARAAYMLTHPAVCRGLIYGLGYKFHEYQGDWPYNRGQTFRAHADKIISRAFPHVTGTLFIPPVFSGDPAINNPVAWIEQHLKTFDPQALDAA